MDIESEQKNYHVFEAEKEGKPVWIIINEGFKATNQALFPWRLWISINIADKTGYPDEKEAKILNDLEDLIESNLKVVCDFVYLGRTTWNGFRELYYYLNEPEPAHKYLKTLTDAQKPIKPFEYRIEKDEQRKLSQHMMELLENKSRHTN